MTAVPYLSAVAASVGTAAWAVMLADSPFDTLRYGIIFAGILALISCAVVPPCEAPDVTSAGLGALLMGYQGAIHVAVAGKGAHMQAIINCNIILICIYRHFWVDRAGHAFGLALAAVAAASTAALLASHRF